MALSLDGNISYIGTEFIKLLNTGSSHLATEQYVNDAIAEGGGGGGDLSNYYTQTQTDNLLNNKLNVINPHDIIGNLRLDPTNGNSKIILNATSPPNNNDDFYCNGSAHINGTLRVSLLTSDGDLNADGCNADTFNSNVITNDIIFNHNDVEYMRFNATDDEIQLSKNIELNEDLIMKSTKVLYLDATSNLLRYITTRNDNGQDILELVNNKATNNQIRFTNNGSTSMIVDNSFLFSERQIQGNNGLKVDFIDTRTASANFDFRRNNVSYITFNSDRININQSLHLANSLTIDTANKLTLKPSLESGVNIFDIRNLHPVADNPMIRFRVGEGGGETIVCEMTNNAISIQRNIIVGTAYELRTNAIDTTTDNDLVISRNNIPFLTLDKFTEDVNGTPTEREAIILSKQLRANAQIRVNNLQINQFSSGVQYTDFRLENADSVMRFYVGNGTSANLQMTNAGIDLRRETTIGSVKTNTINSNGNATLNLQQNGNLFISLLGDALNRVQINRFLRVVDGGESTQAQFVNNSNGNYMEFRLGNHINAYSSGTPVNGNTLHLNYYSHGDVMLGTNQDTGEDPIPTISINKFKSGAGNAFEVQGNSVFSGTVSTNTLNSESGDLTIQRDGTDVINIFTYTPTNGPSILVDAQSDCGISSSWLFANTFANRTGDTDTEFRGAISGGLSSGKVYMKYLHATETLDFDCVIDNTSQNVIGNIINTAVSDKRLKTNIQDIDANYSDCVKNVKLKTFEFKDKKYHNQDKYGMIAQDLLEHLPNEFKGIVRENKPKKDGDKEYLSIDYMKLSLVLWGCCQEQQSKIEHLEARLFELEDIVKDKKKSTPKSKAKAKS